MKNKINNIILFDGVCNLCNSSIQFIIKKDKKNVFTFASLQSDAAKNILLQYFPKKKNNNRFNTIYLIKNGTVLTESTAILHVFKELKLPYKLLFWFIIIPKFIRDIIYKFISKNRYKWFGKKDTCMVPTKELKSKFL